MRPYIHDIPLPQQKKSSGNLGNEVRFVISEPLPTLSYLPIRDILPLSKRNSNAYTEVGFVITGSLVF
jgi:hypothetical protein